MRRLLIAICLFVLAGCDNEEVLSRLIPQEEVEFAKAHLALYPLENYDEILEQLDPRIVDDETRAKLEQVAAVFPKVSPTEILTVGSHTIVSNGAWSANLTFQYEFPEQYVIAAVHLEKQGDRLVIGGVNVQPLENSLQEINAFHVNGRGVLGYVFLVLATGVPVFVVASFILCLRTPIPERKWLWAIFVLFGVGTMKLNWTTGEFAYSMLSWQLLGAAFEKYQYGPLILSVGLPFGAIVFWARRKEWSAATGGDLQEPTAED